MPRERHPGLLFHHPSSLGHDPGEHIAGHPDTPQRIEVIEQALATANWLGWSRRTAGPVSQAALAAVHSPSMIQRISELCARGGGAIDPDTYVGPASCQAAHHAAGAACDMVRALLGGEARVGFAVVRPSGHHASSSRSMGFCLFNNVAIAAQLALSDLGVERVCIIDFDVHHGNGTAEIFRYRRDVLFASIHQAGLYPGTGTLADVGSGPGLGYTINLPVPAGSDGVVWLSLLEHVIIPAAAEFDPELVLVSAGFDAHRDDPLGGCRLEVEDFAQMACHIRDLGVPVGAVLEGGYDLDALPACVLATMRALVDGEAHSSAPEMIYTPRAAAHIGHHWEL
jgi:acetoin utilization deacetylase AcuC-like enzyme